MVRYYPYAHAFKDLTPVITPAITPAIDRVPINNNLLGESMTESARRVVYGCMLFSYFQLLTNGLALPCNEFSNAEKSCKIEGISTFFLGQCVVIVTNGIVECFNSYHAIKNNVAFFKKYNELISNGVLVLGFGMVTTHTVYRAFWNRPNA